MQPDGEPNDDQQEVAADSTVKASGSDNSLQPQPVMNSKLSKLHWSVLWLRRLAALLLWSSQVSDLYCHQLVKWHQ